MLQSHCCVVFVFELRPNLTIIKLMNSTRCHCEDDTGFVGACHGEQVPEFHCEGCGSGEPYADDKAELCASCVEDLS